MKRTDSVPTQAKQNSHETILSDIARKRRDEYPTVVLYEQVAKWHGNLNQKKHGDEVIVSKP
ncbi:hypothetical protein [Gimesia aquarii]|uniref:hypothetical protein n=1 Tax=Gimesia aquarii TaxID=2527964 RepID=UPI0011A4AB58|nr:hypothetical protein [Gimesia aquarii]